MSENETTTRQMTSNEPTGAAVRPHAAAACEQIWSSIFAEGGADARARSVLFTSAERKEGASTLLAGAALVGAGLWSTEKLAVLDLNVRHPNLYRLLGGRPAPGLAEVVGGSATLESVSQPVGSQNLRLYAPGGEKGERMNLLAGGRLGELIRQIAEDNQYVLCDCAAVNIYPDAQVLAPLFDGVVLVTEAGATRREALAQAKKRIELAHGRVLGVVLNKRRYPVPRFLYRMS